MRFLFLFLVLTTCAVQDCRFNPNAHLLEPIKTVKGTTDNKTTDPTPKTLPNIQDLKERLTPGGQYSCKF